MYLDSLGHQVLSGHTNWPSLIRIVKQIDIFGVYFICEMPWAHFLMIIRIAIFSLQEIWAHYCSSLFLYPHQDGLVLKLRALDNQFPYLLISWSHVS